MSKPTIGTTDFLPTLPSLIKPTLSTRLLRSASLALVFGVCTFVAPLKSVHAQEAEASPQAATTSAAQATVATRPNEPITVTLKAERVETDSEGKETLVPAPEAKPGDTLLYTATCANVSDRTISGIQPVIPVPEGVTLVEASITPKAKEASLDGATFVSYPATRTVTATDGKEITAPVPANAYRAIRWEVAELAAGASTDLSFRVSVNQTTVEAVPTSSEKAD